MITLEEAYKIAIARPTGEQRKRILEYRASFGRKETELPKAVVTHIYEADDCWGFNYEKCLALQLVFKSDGHKDIAPTCPGDDPRDYVELPQEVLEELKKKFD